MASVCVTCREINKHCEHEKINTGHKWAAPRKTNDKAWKMIAEGDIWWDKRRVNRPLRTMQTAQELEEIRTERKLWKRSDRYKQIQADIRRRSIEWMDKAGFKMNSRTNRRRGKKSARD
jgi:hypothetical protein